jgi:hypothetical protein
MAQHNIAKMAAAGFTSAKFACRRCSLQASGGGRTEFLRNTAPFWKTVDAYFQRNLDSLRLFAIHASFQRIFS